MNFHGLALHCLLILALACNGLASGMSVQTMTAHQAPVSHESHSPTATSAPCHEGRVDQAVRQPAQASEPIGSKLPDCCDDSRCQCACSMQVTFVAVHPLIAGSIRLMLQPAIDRTDPIRVAASVPLLRPPIA